MQADSGSTRVFVFVRLDRYCHGALPQHDEQVGIVVRSREGYQVGPANYKELSFNWTAVKEVNFGYQHKDTHKAVNVFIMATQFYVP